MPITPFLEGAVFQPEVLRAMGEAFENACRIVSAADHIATKEGIAQKIIEAAAKGEGDPGRLRDIALKAYGIHR